MKSPSELTDQLETAARACLEHWYMISTNAGDAPETGIDYAGERLQGIVDFAVQNWADSVRAVYRAIENDRKRQAGEQT